MSETLPSLLRVVEVIGGNVFTVGRLNLNVIGIRNPDRRIGRFDDEICAVYRETDRGPFVVRTWPATTDPGVDGSKGDPRAILKPGWYRGALEVGRHRGRYEALVQRSPMTVFRDSVGDGRLTVPGPEESGIFGINIHAASNDPYASPDRNGPESVSNWSEGCQVFRHSADFVEFMRLVSASELIYGEVFSYTLLEAKI